MKKLICLIAIIMAISSCNQIPEETRVLSKEATDSVFVLDVPNARCPKCQNIIEGGLANEAGVKQSILNLHTKQVSIVYAPDQTTSQQLEEKVSGLVPQLPCK